MLELRPTCENCNVPLSADAGNAMICSFECTFCADCVEKVLHNVCPNCGGGFERRPVRPAHNHRGGNDTEHYPPSDRIKHRPVDPATHDAFAAALRNVPPGRR